MATFRFAVSYNANGGSPTPGGKSITETSNIPYSDVEIELKVSSVVPTRTNYVFQSWGGYAPGSTISHRFVVGEVPQDASYTATLTAVWYHEQVYVYFGKNTTDTVTNMPSTVSHAKGYSVIIPSNVPVRTGYKFLGWSTSTEIGSGTVYQPNQSAPLYGTTSLYALWERDLQIWTKVSSTWRQGLPWIKVSGKWKQAYQVWVKVSGTWRHP